MKKTLVRLGLAAGLVALTSLAVARPAHAAAALAVCSAGLTISTTSLGTVTTFGPVIHFSNSGVGGQYSSGAVSGYTFSGAQDITLNTATKRAELHGSYTATGSAGTFTVSYVGFANLTTGVATGFFATTGGTGGFASFQWAGSIHAQLTSLNPPSFVALDSGPCLGGPSILQGS